MRYFPAALAPSAHFKNFLVKIALRQPGGDQILAQRPPELAGAAEPDASRGSLDKRRDAYAPADPDLARARLLLGKVEAAVRAFDFHRVADFQAHDYVRWHLDGVCLERKFSVNQPVLLGAPL